VVRVFRGTQRGFQHDLRVMLRCKRGPGGAAHASSIVSGVRVSIVDAFTDRPFAGNPAAVCLLPEGDWPEAAWMQSLAAELNLPMTAFVLPRGEAAYGLRWFNPQLEERLCGHATLATAAVLGGDALRFETLSGELRASVAGDGTVTLDFPRADVTPRGPVDGLAEALGVAPSELLESATPHDLIAVLADEAAVAELAPDLDALAAIQRREQARLVVVTAPGSEHDFVSRVFSPADGIPEDPVTGSAHCALAPLWSARLGADRLVGHQLSARGGIVETELGSDRVLLRGRTVTVLEGELDIGV
jgi:PhzF family phenazine biosynthesis protein